MTGTAVTKEANTVTKKPTVRKSFYQGHPDKLSNSDFVLEDYLKGEWYDRASKTRIQLDRGFNKYNKECYLRLNEINIRFIGLIRANGVVIKLLKQHNYLSHGDLHTIYRLTGAQSGTIRYNRLLKRALKTYAITKRNVYDAIKKEIDKQEDRSNRNKELLNWTLNDYGFDKLDALVQQVNHRDLVTDIIQFMLDSNINIDYQALDAEGLDEEARKKRINEYYDAVDDKYISYLMHIAKANNISLFETISDDLAKRHAAKEANALKIKQDQKEQKKQDKLARAKDSIYKDNIALNKELGNGARMVDFELFGQDLEKGQSKVGIRNALALRQIVTSLGGTAYYIATCQGTTVKYIDFTNKIPRICGSIVKALTIKTAAEAQAALEKAKKIPELADCIVEIMKLQAESREYAIESKENAKKVSISDIRLKVMQEMSKNMPFFKKKILNSVLRTDLINKNYTMLYTARPIIKIIVYYRVGLAGILNIEYLSDTKDSSYRGRTLNYVDCNGNGDYINADISRDIHKIAIISAMGNNKVNIDTSSIDADMEGYTKLELNLQFNFESYINEIIPIGYNYINRLLADGIYGNNESNIINSKIIYNRIQERLKTLRDEGYTHVYAIMTVTENSKDRNFLVFNESKKELEYRTYMSSKVAFLNTDRQLVDTIIKVTRDINGYGLITPCRIDLSMIKNREG